MNKDAIKQALEEAKRWHQGSSWRFSEVALHRRSWQSHRDTLDTAIALLDQPEQVEALPPLPGIHIAPVNGDIDQITAKMDKITNEWTMQAARGECAWICSDCSQSFHDGMPDQCAYGRQECTAIIQRDKAAARQALLSKQAPVTLSDVHTADKPKCLLYDGGAYCSGSCPDCEEDKRRESIGNLAHNLSRDIMKIVNGTWLPGGAPQIQEKIRRAILAAINNAALLSSAQPSRDQVLEEAAKVCEERAQYFEEKDYYKPPELASCAQTGCEHCAAAIRALGAQPKGEKE